MHINKKIKLRLRVRFIGKLYLTSSHSIDKNEEI